MTTGELEGKLVPDDFSPSCSNCAHAGECAQEPRHPAYPRAWRWTKLGAAFPEGLLVLSSWVGFKSGGAAGDECRHYRVAAAQCAAAAAKHVEYANIERRRRQLELGLRGCNGGCGCAGEHEAARREIGEIEERQRALLAG